MPQVLVVEAFVTNSGKNPGAIKAFSVKGGGEKQFQYLRSGSLQYADRYSHQEIEAEIVEPGKSCY